MLVPNDADDREIEFSQWTPRRTTAPPTPIPSTPRQIHAGSAGCHAHETWADDNRKES